MRGEATTGTEGIYAGKSISIHHNEFIKGDNIWTSNNNLEKFLIMIQIVLMMELIRRETLLVLVYMETLLPDMNVIGKLIDKK